MSRPAAWVGLAVFLAVLSRAGAAVHAAIVTEAYTTRAAFASRLGGAVQTITFDDVATDTVDPAPFASDRYAPFGLLIEGQSGQYASRGFGFAADYPVSSPPNLYAPGPIEEALGGGHVSELMFVSGPAPATVAGFGAVFVDPDLPLSTLTVLTDEGGMLGSVDVPADDGERVFRGIVAVDDLTGLPAPVIARVLIVNGTGWPGAELVDGVPLDDFVFGLPAGIATTTSTTTLVDGGTSSSTSSTSTTTLAPAACAPAPAPDCRAPASSGGAVLLARDKKSDARDTLDWRVRRGPATTKADFGDPLAATGFRLCVYDAGGLRVATEVPAGGRCGAKPCWKSTPAGFRYRNPAFVPGGVGLLVLKAGDAGRARIVLQAKGADLALALPVATPVTVQLTRSDGGACWSAPYGGARKNTATRLRATSD